MCGHTASAWAEVRAKCRRDTFSICGLTSAEHNCVVPSASVWDLGEFFFFQRSLMAHNF